MMYIYSGCRLLEEIPLELRHFSVYNFECKLIMSTNKTFPKILPKPLRKTGSVEIFSTKKFKKYGHLKKGKKSKDKRRRYNLSANKISKKVIMKKMLV